MNIEPHVTAQGSHEFTSRAGLMVPATLLERLMPEPGNNRSYRNGTVFDTFMPAFHESAQCLVVLPSDSSGG